MRRIHFPRSWVFFLLISLISAAHAQFLTDANGEFRLNAGSRLLSGQIAMSKIGSAPVAVLAMQTDGNLVLNDINQIVPKWTSGTHGNAGAYLEMQIDGNLVIYTAGRQALWASGSQGYGADSHARLQSDGNFVVYSKGALWASSSQQSSFTQSGLPPPAITRLVRGDTVFSRNQQFYMTLQSDHNLVIYRNGNAGALWATGQRGDVASLQSDGNFVLRDGYGNAVWATNTNGTGPNVELLFQDDGNLVLYGYQPRWSYLSDATWYDRLCAIIDCKVKGDIPF